jgi:TonB family protein
MTDRRFPICRATRGAKKMLSPLAVALFLSVLPSSAPRLQAQDAAKPKRKVVVMHQPDYPYVLTNGHFEGEVRLEATVQANGSVSKVETKGGNPMLAKYAMEAVLKWKYAPAPAQTVEEVSFKFNSH